MATFQLTNSDGTFDFDLTGVVQQSGERIGSWTTTGDASSGIAILKPDGTRVTFDVTWKFNADNQLCLLSGGNPVINFHTANGNVPSYALASAVLQVTPDQNNPNFSFDLRGEWDMNESHDLSVNINGQTSVIDGYVEDTDSRFVYFFFDKTNDNLFSLTFSGEWTSHTGDDGVLRLDFKYDREDGSTDTFSLPQEATIDRSVNQFSYKYNKNDRTREVKLVGLLRITPDFQLIYSIDRQETPDSTGVLVRSTEFKIAAQIRNEAATGDIEFIVKKTDGQTGSTVLGIRGNFTARLGSSQLQVGFQFSQQRNGNLVQTSFFFDGKLTFANGQVQWAVQVQGGTTTISIATGDIQLSNTVSFDARLNLTVSAGQVQSVTALFGIAF